MVNYPIRQLSSFPAFNTLIIANPKKKKKERKLQPVKFGKHNTCPETKTHKVESYELLFPEIKYITKTFLHH